MITETMQRAAEATPEWQKYLGAGFIGSALTTLLSWLVAGHAAKRAARLAHLREQLAELYGPLAFLTQANHWIMWRHGVLQRDGSLALGANSDQVRNQAEAVAQEAADVDILMAMQADYITRIKHNNKEIVDLIRAKYHLLDLDDQDICNQFSLYDSRLDVESGKLANRPAAFRPIDPVVVADSQFYIDIGASYQRKRNALQLLIGKALIQPAKPKRLVQRLDEDTL